MSYIYRNLMYYHMIILLLTLNIFSTSGGTIAGESCGTIAVNSSEKLLTSSSLLILGTNGAGTFF